MECKPLKKDRKIKHPSDLMILSKRLKMQNDTKITLLNLANLRSDLRNKIIDMIPKDGFLTKIQRLKNAVFSFIRRLCIFEPVLFFPDLN